jgi:hypothetical protein
MSSDRDIAAFDARARNYESGWLTPSDSRVYPTPDLARLSSLTAARRESSACWDGRPVWS